MPTEAQPSSGSWVPYSSPLWRPPDLLRKSTLSRHRITRRRRVLTALTTALVAACAAASSAQAERGHVFPIDGHHSYGSPYGEDRGTYYHRGYDLPAAAGTPLRAVSAGRVAYRQYQSGGAGYYVVIHGDDGRDSVYMHMQGPAYVSPGTRVAAGQRIGRVGSTGHSSGPHLHFELWTPHWYDGGYDYNPLSRLRDWDRPPRPQDLTARRDGGDVILDWAPVREGDLSGYRVYRRTPDTNYSLIAKTGSSAYTDRSTRSGQTYYYRVKAYDSLGFWSYWSTNYASVGETTASSYVQTVDNGDSQRFSASSSWGRNSWNSERHGADYRYAAPKPVSDAARFRLRVPSTGAYEVYVWYPSRSSYSAGAPIGVKTTTGMRWHRVDQRSGGGRWVSLGTHTLPAGDDWTVLASRWTSAPGDIVTDAVRIVER